MQWVPDTIDAITRLYKEAGVSGIFGTAIVLAVFLLVVTFSLILLRYTSQIVDLGREWVMVQREVGMNLGVRLDSQTKILQLAIESQTEKIESTNSKLDDQLQKLIDAFGSDFGGMCKLNDAANRLAEAAKERGFDMTIEQATALLSRRMQADAEKGGR